MIHIGQHIRHIAKTKGISAEELSKRIFCSRTHIYKLYRKYHLDTDILIRLSKALEHDFFAEYSKAIKLDRK